MGFSGSGLEETTFLEVQANTFALNSLIPAVRGDLPAEGTVAFQATLVQSLAVTGPCPDLRQAVSPQPSSPASVPQRAQQQQLHVLGFVWLLFTKH